MRLDPLAGDAADVRELLGVDQGNQPMKGVSLTLVRGGRKHQEIWRSLGQALAQLESGYLIGAATETVCFVHDDQVPAGGDQVLEPLPVVLAHLGRAPAAPLVQRLDRVHRHDHLRKHLPGIGGQNLQVGIALFAVSRARHRGDPFQGLDVLGEHELEGLAEVEAHLADPLAHQSLRGDDQRPLDQPAKLELPQNESGLDGLAQADLVRQEIAHAVVGDGAGQGPYLVRKRDDGGLDGSEQDVLGQGVGYPCGSSDVGDIVRRAGACALQGLEPGSRDTDHGVAPGQPDAAGCLTPERLGFDDLTELPVVRAVVPAIRVFRIHRPHLLHQKRPVYPLPSNFEACFQRSSSVEPII